MMLDLLATMPAPAPTSITPAARDYTTSLLVLTVHQPRSALSPSPVRRSDRDPSTTARSNRHRARRSGGCPAHRDFLPWRFSDSGLKSVCIVSPCRRPKTCTIADIYQYDLREKERPPRDGLSI